MFIFKEFKFKTTNLLALIIVLCILLPSLCGCSNYLSNIREKINKGSNIKEETAAETVKEDSQKTIHEIVEIYFNNQDVWYPELNFTPMYGRNICFMDLDFDGVLELIVTFTDGTMRNSESHFYTIDKVNNTVVEIDYNSDNNEGNFNGADFGYSKIDTVKLYKKSNGDMRYWVYDYTFAGSLEHTCLTSEFALNDGKIINEPILNVYSTVDGYTEDASETKVHYLFKNNESVEASEDDYNDFIDNYETENIDLNLNMEYIYDYDSSNDNDKYDLLFNCYKSFSYNGYVAPEVGENRKEAEAKENGEAVTMESIEKPMVDYSGYTVDDVAEIWGSDYKLLKGLYKGGWKDVIFNNNKCPFVFYLANKEVDDTTCNGTDVICAIQYIKNKDNGENFFVSDGVSVDLTIDEVVKKFGGEPYENHVECGMAYSHDIEGGSVVYYWYNDTDTGADAITVIFE